MPERRVCQISSRVGEDEHSARSAPWQGGGSSTEGVDREVVRRQRMNPCKNEHQAGAHRLGRLFSLQCWFIEKLLLASVE